MEKHQTALNALKELLLPSELGAISAQHMLLAVTFSVLLGGIIWFVYAQSYVKSRRSVMYSSTFGLSLLAMTIITTAMLLAIGSRVGLSLGMVGALSIVRFRAAIKEPLEIVFLFWAIETGALLAAGLFILALCVNVLIGALIFSCLLILGSSESYLLILKGAVDFGKNPHLPLKGTGGRAEEESYLTQRNWTRKVRSHLVTIQNNYGIASIDVMSERWTPQKADNVKQEGKGSSDKAETSSLIRTKGSHAAKGISLASNAEKETHPVAENKSDCFSFEVNYEVRMRRGYSKKDSLCKDIMEQFRETGMNSVAFIRYNV